MRRAEFTAYADQYFRWRTGFRQWRHPFVRVNGSFEVPGKGPVFLAALACERNGDPAHPRLTVVTGPDCDSPDEFRTRDLTPLGKVFYAPGDGLLVAKSVPLLLEQGSQTTPQDILLSLQDRDVASKVGEWILDAVVSPIFLEDM